jgi:hypothetical protein
MCACADRSGIHAIEVYPAGTLLAHGLPASNYKRPEQRRARRALLDQLGRLIELPVDGTLPEENADALDAIVYVLAAADFLSGNARAPDDAERARMESWIWIKTNQRGNQQLRPSEPPRTHRARNQKEAPTGWQVALRRLISNGAPGCSPD